MTEVVLNLPRIPNLVYLLSTTQNSSRGIPLVEIGGFDVWPTVREGKIIELENAEDPGKCLVPSGADFGHTFSRYLYSSR